MRAKCEDVKFKTIFSLRIKIELSKRGFEPVLENDNVNKPGFKCWIYEITPEFDECLDEIMGVKYDRK